LDPDRTMKRPKGVTIIVVYFIGSAMVLIPLILLLSRKDADMMSKSLLLLTAIILIVLSIGLWKMKNWARVCTAVLSITGILSGVASGFFRPVPWHDFSIWLLANYLIVLGIHLGIALYLLSSRAKRVFLS